MTDEQRLASIEKKLDGHGEASASIQSTLGKIAVQNEKIQHVEDNVAALWRKYDALTDPKDGKLTQISQHQASCPRDQIKTLWCIVIPMGLTLIGVAFAVIKQAV